MIPILFPSPPRHVVALSGGKDSVAMALRLRELHPETPFEYVITPTGDELPEMEAHWAHLESILGPMTRLHAENLFEVIEREGMLPNYRARFCTRILKIEPFLDYMNALPAGSVMYVGLRADEETREGMIQKDGRFVARYPMREWGWSLEDVLGYLDCKGISIPKRTDCGCCFFQRLPEWRDLLENYPDRFERYVQLEKKIGHTFRSPGRDTWPAALEDLRAEILSGRKMRETKAKPQKCRFCSM